MIDGKAKLIRDDYCDGLGHCLPACPTGAISFEKREALPYDDVAVQKAKEYHLSRRNKIIEKYNQIEKTGFFRFYQCRTEAGGCPVFAGI